jgi:nucleotide-binding universal stress UspA family protein
VKILLAIDGSRFSEAAAQAVIAQARPGEDEVRVVHVVDLMTNPFPEMAEYCVETEHAQDPRREDAEFLVEGTAKLLRARGLKVIPTVEWGEPRSKIIEDAAKWAADLIVVGSHGRKGLEKFSLGSVSEAVARHAGCSVEIVRIPSTHGGSDHVDRESSTEQQ